MKAIPIKGNRLIFHENMGEFVINDERGMPYRALRSKYIIKGQEIYINTDAYLVGSFGAAFRISEEKMTLEDHFDIEIIPWPASPVT